MSVYDNMAFSLKLKKYPRPEIERRVKEAAGLLGIGQLLERKPKQLSGGQQQRVALGRALVRDPKVFLLDEPLSNLDAKLRAHMRSELIELHRRLGKTMVYVTHDQLEAMTMSTRIAVMQAGRLQQFGTPAEIYHRPLNTFVASFIGTPSMTLVDAELASDGGKLTLRLGGLAFEIAPDLVASKIQGVQKITLGIRPENIVLGSGDAAATIRIVEPTGHESIVTLDIGGQSLIARVSGDIALSMGEAAKFDLRRDRLHFFDRDSGRRLNSDLQRDRHADAA
jgi:multiple sugar transport system ATP-binding protein